VQLFHGRVDNMGEIPRPSTVPMAVQGNAGQGQWAYAGNIPCRASGQHGYAVRVLPAHADLSSPFEPGLVCWG
jgi:starch phosphorylase